MDGYFQSHRNTYLCNEHQWPPKTRSGSNGQYQRILKSYHVGFQFLTPRQLEIRVPMRWVLPVILISHSQLDYLLPKEDSGQV